MNNFRAALLSGKRVNSDQPVQSEKKPRSPGGEGLERVAVPRDAHRTADHRDDDRHRLIEQTATLGFRGSELVVDLINLSGGGAMVRGDFAPDMWERVSLTLGENGTLECAVRWVRGDRIGLEFAHETQIQADPATRDAMLLDVIRQSFPDYAASPSPVAADQPGLPDLPDDVDPVDLARRGEPRHPLIWSGEILFNHDSQPVRLRNISANGALVESPLAYPPGSEVYLDLDGAGSLFATVSWSRGDQVGLAFQQPFDIASLARHTPTIAPNRWSKPQFLRDDQGESSPWSAGWERLSVDELKTSLEGFLKH